MIFHKNNPLKITETVLRDAHQSLMATRMRTEDMLPIIETMDEAGYDSVGMLGRSHFRRLHAVSRRGSVGTSARPSERIQKDKTSDAPSGQNLLGYRHYSDDVVDAFVRKAVSNGIDIIRIFDALNDIRNLERAVLAAKKEGAHVQLAMAYTTGKAYTLNYWRILARQMADMGADSICIKDMAGLLTPYNAEKAGKGRKKTTKLPVHAFSLHQRTGAHDLPESHRSGL